MPKIKCGSAAASAAMAEYRAERRFLANCARVGQVALVGLLALFDGVVWGWLPYNFLWWGPAAAYSRKGGRIQFPLREGDHSPVPDQHWAMQRWGRRCARALTPETPGGLVEVYARMAGFLDAVGESETLTRFYRAIVSPNGVNSPYTHVDLWVVNQAWGSPWAFYRHAKAVGVRAAEILHSRGIAAQLGFTAAGALRYRSVGKAAVWAAASTLGWYAHSQGYRHARKYLEEVFSGQRQPSEWAVRTGGTLKVAKLLGCAPDLIREVWDGIPVGVIQPERGWVMKTWRSLRPEAEAERPHAFQALLRLLASFGRQDATRCLGWVRAGLVTLHDLGIGMPWTAFGSEVKAWYFRQDAGKLAEARRVIKAWDALIGEGWVPSAKGSLAEALALLASFGYEDAAHRGFARECAKWGVEARRYPELEARWLDSLARKEYQTVPAPGGLNGLSRKGITVRMLDASDPRALWAGEHTDCCQHPGGAGQSCAWHAQESPDGAIWAWEKAGRMLAQAWVWRDKDALYLDNVEAMANEEDTEVLRELVLLAAKDVVGRLGVSEVYVGAGGSDVPLEGKTQARRHRPAGFSGYLADSERVWRVA